MKVDLTPVPDGFASRFVADKLPVARRVFDRMLPEIKARAICVSGITDLDAVQNVRDAIAALPQGANWNDVKGEIVRNISPYVVDAVDPDERAKQEEAAEARAELLLRTQGFQAYAASEYQALREQMDVFPFWEYVTARDDRVRDSHAALDGIILPADDPFWDEHYPPWDWGCRCTVRPRMSAEVERLPVATADSTPGTRRVFQGAMLDKLNLNELLAGGRQVSVAPPVARGEKEAWSWNPKDMQVPLDAVLERYDVDTSTAFVAAMQRSKVAHAEKEMGQITVWDHLLASARQEDATSTAAFGERTRREKAVVRNYDTAKIMGTVEGTEQSTNLRTVLDQARAGGDRVVIAHDHPNGNMAPSPIDVATLLANPDAIVSISVADGSGRGGKPMSLRQGEKLSQASRGTLLALLRRCQTADGAMLVSDEKWYSVLQQLIKHGQVCYGQEL